MTSNNTKYRNYPKQFVNSVFIIYRVRTGRVPIHRQEQMLRLTLNSVDICTPSGFTISCTSRSFHRNDPRRPSFILAL